MLIRFVRINVLLAFFLSALLTSCGGGGSGSTNSQNRSGLLIQGFVFSFPAGTGAAPVNMPNALISVMDGSSGANITNARVTVNGVALNYNSAPAHQEFEGSVSINPGAIVTLVVNVGSTTYTATGNMATTYPTISAPASGDTWVVSSINNVAWSGGTPLTNAAYLLGILDAADPVGGTAYFQSISTSTNSVDIPAYSLTSGNRDVIVGITTMQAIPNANPSSGLIIGGFNYVPVSVNPIAAPSNVQAILGDGQVTVSWNPYVSATSYNIYWSTIASNANKVSGNKIAGVTSPYTHAGLANGAAYYYSVTAVSVNGEGPESTVASATPGVPVNASARPGNAQATVSWPATGAATYNIYWSTTAANTNMVSGTKIAGAVSPYVQTGLTNGTPYYYMVTPVYPAGEGPKSPVVKAIPGSTLMGGAVQGYPLAPVSTVTSLPGTTIYARSVATDGSNLFIPDTYVNVIRKVVISTGEVSTLAGISGVCGSADGTGTAASFCVPTGITTDGINLYVADSQNCTIRKIVIATGVVTTFAGTAGVNCAVNGSVDGIGSAASFGTPYGITTDGTNLYVADQRNSNIRKIAIATAAVTTLATGGFFGPTGITTDGTNLYVADNQNNAIKQVVIATGVVTTLAGSNSVGTWGLQDGTGTNALFTSPQGITSDGTNLYVADCSNHAIRKIVISTAVVTTVAVVAAGFFCPQGITTDGINLFVTDGSDGIVRIIQ